MSAGLRLALFAGGLAALVVVGFGVGRALDPAPSSGISPHSGADEHGMEAMDGIDAVRGLSVAEGGLRLELADPERARGVAEPLRFRVVGEDGRAMTEFDETHTRRLHLIVVRRDLTGFQHLHPEMAADGTWSVPLRLDEAGFYRLFADFSADDEPVTLAADLRVDGAADLVALPAPAAAAESDGGLEVSHEAGRPRSGEEARLRFTVSDRGRPLELQPYLGASGHLVALREGDLAFLHVHPIAAGGDGSIEFEATFPTAGRYRLFLQFKVDGELHTVAFTEEVE